MSLVLRADAFLSFPQCVCKMFRQWIFLQETLEESLKEQILARNCSNLLFRWTRARDLLSMECVLCMYATAYFGDTQISHVWVTAFEALLNGQLINLYTRIRHCLYTATTWVVCGILCSFVFGEICCAGFFLVFLGLKTSQSIFHMDDLCCINLHWIQGFQHCPSFFAVIHSSTKHSWESSIWDDTFYIAALSWSLICVVWGLSLVSQPTCVQEVQALQPQEQLPGNALVWSHK